MSSSAPLLAVNELAVVFHGREAGDVRAVDGVSFSLEEGRVTGLVGESGCGKSVTSLALMGLLPEHGVTVGGSALMRLPNGQEDLLQTSRRRMRDLRGSQLAMIFQDPLSSLNPVVPIGSWDPRRSRDRKSTRLNSSHVAISYAVFCLKKKKRKTSIP